MNTTFETYKPRNIFFSGWTPFDEWTVKTYKITNREHFSSNEIFENIIRHLPVWLKQIENSQLPIYKQAFLIVHEAREGVWILLNWWTGGEMVETKVFFSSFDSPNIITASPYNTNSLLCVWELEVFAHERKSWIVNVLSNPQMPDFENYKHDVFNTKR
ncbi:hypothetical protein [Maribacter aestuarii]|uniref:hypothetical protein n=1 Tax=Maribacter aestuarii TaxID=1130723 RepID=UPI0025A5876E|nr:hypothetical protein [Maribacter aestuarii]